MKKGKISRGIILVLDVFCILISYLLAAYIREGILNSRFLSSLYSTVLVVTILLYIVIYALTGNKNENDFKRGFFDEFIEVIKKQLYLAIFLSLFLFVTQSGVQYSRFFFAVFFVINTMLSYVVRSYIKLIMLLGYRKSSASSKVLIITVYNRAEEIIRKIRSEYEWAMQITSLAILDMDMTGSSILGVEVRANRDNIYETVMKHVVDEVFINIPYQYKLNLEELILEFENMGIVVHLNVDIYNNIKLHEKSIQALGGYQVITFTTKIFELRQVVAKRLLDILGAIIGLIVTSLLTLILAPLIKVESSGPIFFTQIRIGKNGRKFKLYKFRSMYEDAEARKKELMDKNEMNGLMFKVDKDPRITKIGRFLRKTSIDEFPQFFNVLRGDMSLVGTRPPTVDEFVRYESKHMKRLSIKPGITGLWQVSGRSNIKDFEEVVRMDLEYIDNWSLRLDLKLLVKTVLVVVLGRGSR